MKKFLSILLVLIMVIGMMPYQISAATDLSFNGGTITLAADTKVGSLILTTLSIYKQKATSNYPEIVSAIQDGNTIDITLAEETDLSYPLQMGFSTTSNMVLTHSGNTCTLQNGHGTSNVTVSFRPAQNAPTYTAAFTVNFTVVKGETYAVTVPTGEGFTFDGASDAAKDKDYSFGIIINEG